MTGKKAPPLSDVDDDTVILLIMERDQEGIRHLLGKYGGKVVSYLKSKFSALLNDDGRLDVLFRAADRVWRYIDSYDDSKGSLWAWLLGIAHKQALNVLNEECAPASELIHEPQTTADQDKEIAPERVKMFEDLDQVIERLPPRQRNVARADLRCGGEASGPELAAELNTTANAIRIARCKYRKTVADEMTRLGHRLGGEA